MRMILGLVSPDSGQMELFGKTDLEQSLLAEELKLSCTNVMLQCLDAESRCIFILGTMFKVDSRIAGDILGITPEAYRQRLSRVRKKVADFLKEYCIGEFDSSVLHNRPKDLTFKLVRDTWFSHDKSPYNPAFRAHISSKGKLPVPVGYYLMIKPGGQSFLGGGLFADMFKDATTMVRDYITEHGEELEEIIHAPEFQKHFKLQGTSLKNVPAGYDREHPQAEYLKCKSWYLEYPVKDEDVADAGVFVEEAAKLFRIMKPFNDYLNKALDGFQMPSR